MRALAEIERLCDSLKPNPNKSCSGCTACCHSLPVPEIGLPAWHRCKHERGAPFAQPGCAIYPNRPDSCRAWSCGWRISDWGDDSDLRPDRCGVIVDPMDDIIWLNGKELPVVRLWVMPGHEEDYNSDPVLALILALLNEGHSLIWDMAPNAEGQRLARAIVMHQGKLSITAPTAASNTGMTDGERFWRAQDLQRR